MKSTRLGSIALLLGLVACGGGPADSLGHSHGDGSDHSHGPSDDGSDQHGGGEHEDEHPVEALGVVEIGGLAVELAQGHGAVEAGKESHLVVKLLESDAGATTVRAWIGTEDRLGSYVGKGEYARDHDDYDVHAVAPDPLPEGARWWIELERPEGTRLVGSADPLWD